MQKKLIALAVAGMFAAPAAFAATANVDVGGYLNFSVDYLDADMDEYDGNINVSSNASNIYFKGSEDLGGGMKAFWQIQTYFSAGATGNTDTSFGANADGVSSGNTFVGLESGFGKVALGKMEAPVKLLSRKVDLFGNQIGDSRNLTNKGMDMQPEAGGFDLRPNNVIAYTTPNMTGFSATAAYVTNISSGAASEDSGSNSDVDAWSIAGMYENGPLYVGLGYQVHNWSDKISSQDDENIWRLSASYKISDLRLVALYQREGNLNTGCCGGDDRTVWGLGAAYNMGAITLKGQYYNAGETADDDHTGADMWAVGVDYALSKRTMLQFAYASTDNDSDANYSAFGGGHGDNPGTTDGGNPSGFSIGVVHSF